MTTLRMALVLTLLATGCGPGELAAGVRPAEVSAEEARGAPAAPCALESGYAEPLVVDLSSEARGDLEVAMKQGVAVVSYDCNSLRILSDCSIPGSYGFVGMTRKEEVIELQDADELQANLPFSAVNIGGQVSRERAVHIGLMMVGKSMAPLRQADRSKLEGKCEAATHFVRGATLGAFAMAQATAGKLSTAVEIFELGGSGSSNSERSVERKDGDLSACKKADANAEAPPSQCGALLRLQLTAIDGGGAPASTDEGADLGSHCPKGFVFAEDKCTRPSPDVAHQCVYRDARDCLAQCDKGNRRSCVILGAMHREGAGVPKNGAKALELLESACRGGDEVGCAELGVSYFRGAGGKPDYERARASFVEACGAGVAGSCYNLGVLYWTGKGVPKDRKRAANLIARACNAGSGKACGQYGGLLVMGGPLERDVAKARKVLDKSCAADDAGSCAQLGNLHFWGIGTDKDPSRAALLFQSACDAGDGVGCDLLGVAYELGAGAERDMEQARSHHKRACKAHAGLCASLGVFMEGNMQGGGSGRYYRQSCPKPDCELIGDSKLSCQAGEGRACTVAGALLKFHDEDEAAAPLFARGCKLGDIPACSIQRRMKR